MLSNICYPFSGRRETRDSSARRVISSISWSRWSIRKKNETILDPACGTAGFLISAYKHIMASNRPNGSANPAERLKRRKGRERTKAGEQLHGYDISPDMVRLSLVNLYLHGFITPQHFRIRHAHQRRTLERVRRCDPCQPAVHVAKGRHQAAQTFLGAVEPQ